MLNQERMQQSGRFVFPLKESQSTMRAVANAPAWVPLALNTRC